MNYNFSFPKKLVIKLEYSLKLHCSDEVWIGVERAEGRGQRAEGRGQRAQAPQLKTKSVSLAVLSLLEYIEN
jgi:hypothetical protein